MVNGYGLTLAMGMVNVLITCILNLRIIAFGGAI